MSPAFQAYELPTPNGVSVMLVAAPLHVGFVGGAAANVSPPTAQLIAHAVAVIVNGDNPESKTGVGSFPPAGVPEWKMSVAGSIAYCQLPVAVNWTSAARGSWAF